MKTIAELNGEYKSLYESAERLAAEGKTAEATAALGKLDEVMAAIDIAKRLDAGKGYLAEPAGTKAAQFRAAGPDEGDAPVDEKAFRSFTMPVATPYGVEQKEFRYHVPLAVQKKGYKGAFESYLRRGIHEVGPNDRKALTEAVDAAGGYLVPEDVQASILRKIATMAVVRQYARVIQISRDIASWPRIKYTTDNDYTSGMRMTWTGETPSSSTIHRVTDQVFGNISIPVHTGMTSQLVSNDLIEDDAYDVMGISGELMAEAFALGENTAFWSGNGGGQPLGILNSIADTVNWAEVAVTLGGAVDTFTADELIDAIYALPAQYERNARVFLTKATEKFIRKFSDTDGNYLWPVWNNVGNLGVIPNSLLGFPVVRDEAMDDISTASLTATYPVVLADLSGYVVADRVGLSIQRIDTLYAETNNTLLLGRKRVGGSMIEPYRFSALKTVHTT